MPFTRADVLTAAQRSLTAAGAHDRDGWLSLFTRDGRVEDPVGSTPHQGHTDLGRFYDTFIGPRTITHRLDGDIVVDTTVIRDVELEIDMTSALTMRVPTFIRYDLRTESDELKIGALSAYWELPAMMAQFARGGVGAVPAGVSLGRAMFTNQGLTGTLGFLGGFRGLGSGGKAVFARFLDNACAGDEVGMRRVVSDTPVMVGDTDPLTASDLLKLLAGGTWSKLIGSGRSVSARVEREGHRSVVIGEIGEGGGRNRAALRRIRYFGEIN